MTQARVNAAHHSTSDHADFVEEDDLGMLEMFLQRVESVVVLDVMERTEIEPVYQAVYSGGIKFHRERGCSGGCSAAHEIGWELIYIEDVADFL